MGDMLKHFNREHIILAAFVLLPVTILTAGLIHDGHRIALFVMSLGIMAAYVGNRWLAALMLYAMAWQVFVCILTMRLSPPPKVLLTSIDQYVYYVVAAAIFLAVRNSKLEKETYYNAVCVAVLLQVAIGALQFFGFDPYVWTLNHWIIAVSLFDGINGTLGNPNFHCAFLAISLPMFFRRGWRWCVPVLLLFIIYSHVSTAVFSACAAIAVYFWHWTWGVAGVLTGLVYAFWYDGNIVGNERFIYWRGALEAMSNWPLTYLIGVGPGIGFRHEFPLHNEWLTVFWRYGALGLALVVGYVVTAYREDRILFACFVAACVNAIGSYPLHLAPSVFLLMIVMGLMERERNG